MEVMLRSTTESDLDYVVSAEHDPQNSAFVIAWTKDQHQAALVDPNIAHMMIEPASDPRPVGYVILAGLQNPHRNVEFMRLVVTEKGMGYGRAAVEAVKRHAFEVLSAHRLWLDVKEHNSRARELYRKCGFRQEGTLRECLKGPDGFETLVVMAMLEQEYRSS